MKRLSQAISLAAFVAVAAGCSSPVKIADNAGAPVESRTPVPGGAGSSGATQPAAQSQVTPVSVDPSAMLARRASSTSTTTASPSRTSSAR